MTPRRYLSTAIQRLTTDNRGSDHAENMHDEIHALRKALRDMTAWNERLQEEIRWLRSQLATRTNSRIEHVVDADPSGITSLSAEDTDCDFLVIRPPTK